VIPASSINALGYYFGKVQFPILYFPVDEEHPTFTTDSYSFSKQIVEQIAAYYHRREGIDSVCLRLPAVLSRDGEALERMREMMGDYPRLARTFGRNNFWTMIDDRDAALAFELALRADIQGSHAVYVNDCMNIVGIESERLLRKHFPEVKGRKHPLVDDETLLSNARAGALLGYEPQHSWRDLVRGPESPFKTWDVPLW
jgi:nucleoside-diphosphate-sugar epimerase